jgi:hypothetical protein
MEPRQGTGSSASGWERLWAAVCPAPGPHPVGVEELGEYGALLRRAGPAAAAGAFPAVVAHLQAGCAACDATLADLLDLLDE